MLSTSLTQTDRKPKGAFSHFLKRKKPPTYGSHHVTASGATDDDAIIINSAAASSPPPPPPKDKGRTPNINLGEFGQPSTKPRSYTVGGHGYEHDQQQQLPQQHYNQRRQQQQEDPTSRSLFHHRTPYQQHKQSNSLSSQRLDPISIVSPLSIDRSFNLSEPLQIIHRTSSPPLPPPPTEKPQRSSFEDTKAMLRQPLPQRPLLPKDPKERARLRIEAQRQREREEEEALQKETERQERMKKEKEELMLQEQEEAERRKAIVAREVQLATAQRQRKQYFEKVEEEKHKQELEERKRLDKERRLEENRKMEEWRAEHTMKMEHARKAADMAKQLEEEERKSKILQVIKTVSKQPEDHATTGWVTMTLGDSVVCNWRRRFYKIDGSTLLLYKTVETAESGTPLETIELHRSLSRLCEWSHGYEELKAIPHSFAVEFKNGTKWSMYSDSESAKYKLLALLHQAAGL